MILMNRIFVPSILPYAYPDGLPQSDSTESLVVTARAGCKIARRLLIECKMGLAIAVVKRLQVTDRAELGALSLYHLVKAVDSFLKNGKDTNIDPYIVSVVLKNVKIALFHDRTIRIPHRSAYEARKKGQLDRLNIEIDDYDAVPEDELHVLVHCMSRKAYVKHIALMDSDLDLRDLIERIIARSDDPSEMRLIVELRIRQCTDAEVAEKIGKSKAYVAVKRNWFLDSLLKELE
jgi:hypothetical protein